MTDSKSRSPAPAITDAMVQAAIKYTLCPKCFAMNPWSREPSSCVDCVRTALTAAIEVSGRSPAEVPPNWNENDEVQAARSKLEHKVVNYSHTPLDTSEKLGAAQEFLDALDALCDAVWRSAQQ